MIAFARSPRPLLGTVVEGVIDMGSFESKEQLQDYFLAKGLPPEVSEHVATELWELHKAMDE